MSDAHGIPGANLWTVARQTFVQCLRTRVAAVFAVLLIASLALLPSLMEGDGTLAGRIRTFLDYSTTAVSVLLALSVVLLSVGLISGDVAGKHVMILCTKPLSRWQYVIGRWLGVVMLAGSLLAGSYAAIYLTARYLRGRSDLAVGPQDAQAVATEIFAARSRTPAPPPDVDELVRRRITEKKQQGAWDDAVDSYMKNYGLTAPAAEDRLVGEMRRSAASEAQSAAPGGSLKLVFKGLQYAGEVYQAPGILEGGADQSGIVSVRTVPEMAQKLVIFGPVWVGGADEQGAARGPVGAVGRVVGLWGDGFHAAFSLDDIKAHFANAQPGKAVSVVAQPTLQVSYKLSASQDPNAPRDRLAAWEFENPTDHFRYYVPPQQVRVNQQATVIVPTAAVDPNGAMNVRFINYSAASVTILNSDMSVLYGIGGFEMNFVKSCLLVLMGLMFLAALGIFAGSAFSFGVGCLVSFVLLWIGSAMRFLAEAISYGPSPDDKGLAPGIYWIADWMLWVMRVLLPDLSSTMLNNFLVEGTRITWDYFSWAVLLTVCVGAAQLLALACLVFHLRELARVQV
jgi:hypothetical protein